MVRSGFGEDGARLAGAHPVGRPKGAAVSMVCVALLLWLPVRAEAFSCEGDAGKTARITIPAGGSCWEYRGPAAVFVGRFAGHQRILVRMRGQSASFDEKTGRTTIREADRSPTAAGPAGFTVEADADHPALAFVTLVAGSYRFSFFPCADRGAPGMVRICAE